jgi:hypothetical protein
MKNFSNGLQVKASWRMEVDFSQVAENCQIFCQGVGVVFLMFLSKIKDDNSIWQSARDALIQRLVTTSKKGSPSRVTYGHADARQAKRRGRSRLGCRTLVPPRSILAQLHVGRKCAWVGELARP